MTQDEIAEASHGLTLKLLRTIEHQDVDSICCIIALLRALARYTSMRYQRSNTDDEMVAWVSRNFAHALQNTPRSSH